MPILIGHRQDLRSIGGMKPTRPAVCAKSSLHSASDSSAKLLAEDFSSGAEVRTGQLLYRRAWRRQSAMSCSPSGGVKVASVNDTTSPPQTSALSRFGVVRRV